MESFLDISILKEKIIKTDRVLQMYMELKKKHADVTEKYKQSSSELSLLKLDFEVKSLQLSEQCKLTEKLITEHDKMANEHTALKCNYNKQLDELVSLQMKYQTICRELKEYQNEDKKLSPKHSPIKRKPKKRKSHSENYMTENLNKTGMLFSQPSEDKKNIIKIEILDQNNPVEEFSFPSTIEYSPLSEESDGSLFLELRNSQVQENNSTLLEDFKGEELSSNTQVQEMENKFKQIIEELQVNLEEQNNIFQKKFQEKENEINKRWEEKQKKMRSEIQHLHRKIEDEKNKLTKKYEEKISTLQTEWEEKEGRMEAEIINSRLKNDEEVSKLTKDFEMKEAGMRQEVSKLIKDFEMKEASMRQERNESEMKLREVITNLEEQLRLSQEKAKDKNLKNSEQNVIQKSDYEPQVINSDFHSESDNSKAIETKPVLASGDESEDSDMEFNIEDIFKEMRVRLLSPIPELSSEQEEMILKKERSLRSATQEEKSTQFRDNISDKGSSVESKTPDWSNRYLVNRKRKMAKYRKLSEIKKAKHKFWLEFSQTISPKKVLIESLSKNLTLSSEKDCICVLKETLGCSGVSKNVQSSMEKRKNEAIEMRDQPKIINYFARLSKKEEKIEIEDNQSYGGRHKNENVGREKETAIIGNSSELPIDEHNTTIENFLRSEQMKSKKEIIENEKNALDTAENLSEVSKNQTDTGQSFSVFKDQPENVEIEKPVKINEICELSVDEHKESSDKSLVFEQKEQRSEVPENVEIEKPVKINEICELSLDEHMESPDNSLVFEQKEQKSEDIENEPDIALKNETKIVQTYSVVNRKPDELENIKNIEIEERPIMINDFCKPSVEQQIMLENSLYLQSNIEEQETNIENEKNYSCKDKNFSESQKNQPVILNKYLDLKYSSTSFEEKLRNSQNEDEPEVSENSSSDSIDHQAEFPLETSLLDQGAGMMEKPEDGQNFSQSLKNLLNVVIGEQKKKPEAEENLSLNIKDKFVISENLNCYGPLRESCSYSRKYQTEINENNREISENDSLKPEVPPTPCKRKRPVKGKLMAKSMKIYNLRSCATGKVNNYREIHTSGINSNIKKRANSDNSMVDSPRVKRRKSSSTLVATEITGNCENSQPISESSFFPTSPCEISDTKKETAGNDEEIQLVAKTSFSSSSPCNTGDKIKGKSPMKRNNEKTIGNNEQHKSPKSAIHNGALNNRTTSLAANNKSNVNNHPDRQKIFASQLDSSKINIIQNLILKPKGKVVKTGGFKKPLVSKILPACPQSPPLSSVKATNVVEPVAIIPLEKPAELEPIVVKRLFQKLITYSTEDKTVEEVGQQFSNQEPEFIARSILQQIIVDKDKPDRVGARDPLMTHTQRVMLGFMLKLEKMKVANLINIYLKMSELYLIHTKILSSIEPLARFHVAICKAFGYLERMRRFCLEAFYFMGDLAIPFFFAVLISWIEVLPPANISEGFPLVKVLVQLVHITKCKKPGYNLLPLRELIHKFYEYPNEPWDSDNLFKDLFNNYLKNPVAPADLPIILYCKKNTCKWVHEKIETLIKPILPNVSENFRATLIILIGNIMSCFKNKNHQEYIKSTKDWLEDLLKAEDVSEVVRKSVAYTVAKLPKIRENRQSVDKKCDM